MEQTPFTAPRNSTNAIVSLVSGILGWTFLPFLGSIVAVITGHMAKSEIKRSAGTVGGNGVGVVVLKRLADAIKDGDQIYAIIRGAACNNDGSNRVGFTAPGVEGQAEVIAMAQAVANVEPDTISYIETHGTGTTLGDPIEIAALAQAFRRWDHPAAPLHRERESCENPNRTTIRVAVPMWSSRQTNAA